MRDDRDRRYTTDGNGYTWLIGADGAAVLDAEGRRVPGPAGYTLTESGWRDYDTSRGHCGLCGRLTCRGRCCK